MHTTTPEQFLDNEFDGFTVEVDASRERADIILGRPPYNVIAMSQRETLVLPAPGAAASTRQTPRRDGN